MTAILADRGAAAPAGLILHDVPREIPPLVFADDVGRQRTLEEFRGNVILLKVWATWCGPCRKEMPTLDRLQARLGGSQFQVIALSVDRGGPDAVRRFYAETGVRHFALFIDSAARAGLRLGLFGLPGTLLIDREGRERGRLIGPAEWDSPEMIAFLQSQILQAGTHRADGSQPIGQ